MMGFQKKAVQPAPRPEFSKIITSKPVRGFEGVIPAGSAGVIVEVHEQGAAYEVEFTLPIADVATVEADEIA